MTATGNGAPPRHVIVRTDRRPDPEAVAVLGRVGVATAHEAMGRRGLTHPVLRPIYPGAARRPRGDVLSHPGDNLMIHAVRQCGPGDVSWSPPLAVDDGMFGEVRRQLAARGVRAWSSTPRARRRSADRDELPRVVARGVRQGTVRRARS